MNKEVEGAKEYFEELIKGYEQNLKEIEDFDEYEEEQKFIKRRVSKLKILLNYIKELEIDNDIMKQDLNGNVLYKDELEEHYIPKQKARNIITKLKEENENLNTLNEKQYHQYIININVINVLESLLNEEDK